MDTVLLIVVLLVMIAAVGAAFWALAALMKARTELASRLTGDAALERIRKEAVEAQLQGLENRFAALAAQQLTDRQEDLVGLNAKNVSELFDGLKERLQKYEKEVESAKAESKESAVRMAENVKELQRFAAVAQNYTSALLGGNKIQDIQELGGEVIAKIDELLQDIDSVEASLTKAVSACSDLKKRASEKGQKSIKRVARMLLDYGATTSRQLKLLGKEDPESDG